MRIGALKGKAADASGSALVPADNLTRRTARLARHAQHWLHAWPRRQRIADVRVELCQVQDLGLCRTCHPASHHKLNSRLPSMIMLGACIAQEVAEAHELHTVLKSTQMQRTPQLAQHGLDGF